MLFWFGLVLRLLLFICLGLLFFFPSDSQWLQHYLEGKKCQFWDLLYSRNIQGALVPLCFVFNNSQSLQHGWGRDKCGAVPSIELQAKGTQWYHLSGGRVRKMSCRRCTSSNRSSVLLLNGLKSIPDATFCHRVLQGELFLMGSHSNLIWTESFLKCALGRALADTQWKWLTRELPIVDSW